MRYFAESRSEEDNINFVVEKDTGKDGVYCIGNYCGKHNAYQFYRIVRDYAGRHFGYGSSICDIIDALKAYEDYLSKFLDGCENDDPPLFELTIYNADKSEAHRACFSINGPEINECVEEFFDNLLEGYYEIETM